MTLRIGIIGCGAITAFAHVPALLRRKPGLAEVAGLCDRNLQRAERVKERFGLKSYCTHDPDKLLSDPSLDAVIVATWPSEHVPLALAAIDSGRHVLLQKPLTVNEKESEAIVSAAERTRLNVMALPIVSSVPSLSALRELIISEKLGDIHYTRIRTSISGPSDHYQDVRRFFGEDGSITPPIFGTDYAQGGGCLSDMGPYALALFQFLYGEGRGQLIAAVRDTHAFETAAVLNLRFPPAMESPNSALCTIEVGWSQHSALEVCSVFGSNGAATVTADGKLCLYPLGEESIHSSEKAMTTESVLPTSPVAGQDEWIDAISTNSEAAFVASVRQAAWTANTIMTAYRVSGINA